ncbi:MAG: hypothetical protein JO132_04325 [Streptosporangiaceae bacterium]|nr:hypothetical protein [Streptosporangiaceae bacterium]
MIFVVADGDAEYGEVLAARATSMDSHSPVREKRCMGVIRFRAQLQRRGPAAAVVLDDS